MTQPRPVGVTGSRPSAGLWLPSTVEEVKNASRGNQARPKFERLSRARVLGLGRLIQNLVADVRV